MTYATNPHTKIEQQDFLSYVINGTINHKWTNHQGALKRTRISLERKARAFMLYAKYGYTFVAIGREFGISGKRAGQLVHHFIRRMHYFMAFKFGPNYWSIFDSMMKDEA